jgi:hypothetical protein
MRSKSEMMAELRKLLHDAFVAQAEGANYSRLTRAQAMADGYMRALLDSGKATKEELLALVQSERVLVRGPATKEVAASSLEVAAA